MRILLNVLWIICGGLFSWLGWIIVGCLWCITIIGIPVGRQCFKLASISLDPFGKTVEYGDSGAVSLLLNLLWLVFSGLELAIAHAVAGCVLCVTLVGIPFGLQHFKIAKLALFPFGAEVVREQIF